MKKVVMWDFDGTLAKDNTLWSGAIMETLDELIGEHEIRKEDIKPYLQTGFPWHNPEKAHLELCEPKKWWGVMEHFLQEIYTALGFDSYIAVKLAKETHNTYIKASRFRLYPQTMEVLQRLIDKDWNNIIVSNHVPELPEIVGKLGLGKVITKCYTSAKIGYEKPNRKIFEYVLTDLQYPPLCIMVGDSISADISGAERAGIIPILIHTAAKGCNQT